VTLRTFQLSELTCDYDVEVEEDEVQLIPNFLMSADPRGGAIASPTSRLTNCVVTIRGDP